MAVRDLRLVGDPALREVVVPLFVDRLDREIRRAAMKEIREAHWSGLAVPVVSESPHPMLGRAR